MALADPIPERLYPLQVYLFVPGDHIDLGGNVENPPNGTVVGVNLRQLFGQVGVLINHGSKPIHQFIGVAELVETVIDVNILGVVAVHLTQCDGGRLQMPFQRAGIDAVEADAIVGEMPAQQLGLPLAHRRKAVVSRLPEGGLAVSNQVNFSHREFLYLLKSQRDKAIPVPSGSSRKMNIGSFPLVLAANDQ